MLQERSTVAVGGERGGACGARYCHGGLLWVTTSNLDARERAIYVRGTVWSS